MYSREVKVSDLTLGELLDSIDEHFHQKEREAESAKIKGISGLADFMHCSYRTAQRLKNSGRIDKAIIQSGRTIVIDQQKLVRILHGNRGYTPA